MKLVIHNAELVNEDRRVRGYVAVGDDGRIAAVAEGPAPDIHAAEIVDARGCWLVPGAIDAHVHCRQPGATHKGDIATETAAAALGGVTSVMDMPNTSPPTTTLEAWEEKMRVGLATASTNYAAWLGATADNLEELLQADYSRVPGVKVYMGSTTGGLLLDDTSALAQIFSRVRALVAVHAEDNGIISRTTRRLRAHYGRQQVIPVTAHAAIRPASACSRAVESAVSLAEMHHARLHICHVSSRAELAILASADPSLVTAEACVGHLWWCDDDYRRLGSRIKCNPSIKSADDRRALRQAVWSGRLQTVATDHAPHLLSEKVDGALKAPSGFPTIQYSLPMILTLAMREGIDPATVVRRMCHAPADLFGIEERGYLRPGYWADMALVDPSRPCRVTDYGAAGRCGWTPLAGETLDCTVIRTWVNGQRPVPGAGQALTFNP